MLAAPVALAGEAHGGKRLSASPAATPPRNRSTRMAHGALPEALDEPPTAVIPAEPLHFQDQVPVTRLAL